MKIDERDNHAANCSIWYREEEDMDSKGTVKKRTREFKIEHHSQSDKHKRKERVTQLLPGIFKAVSFVAFAAGSGWKIFSEL